MRILFLHGLDAKPGGPKPTRLAAEGHEVLNPALPRDNFDDAVRIAQAQFDRHRPQVVVGSSRGGAVAMAIRAPGARLVLMAPAWRYCHLDPDVPPDTVILHSPHDAVIPIDDSRQLLAAAGLPPDRLLEVGTAHHMNDLEALSALVRAVRATESDSA